MGQSPYQSQGNNPYGQPAAGGVYGQPAAGGVYGQPAGTPYGAQPFGQPTANPYGPSPDASTPLGMSPVADRYGQPSVGAPMSPQVSMGPGPSGYGPMPAQSPKKSKAGLWIGIGVGTLVLLLILGGLIFALTHKGKKADSTPSTSVTTTARAVSKGGTHKVDLKVKTTGPIEITYTDDKGQLQTEKVSTDWTKSYTVTGFEMVSIMTMTTNYSGDSPKVSCEILVDGASVESDTDDAGVGMVMCVGSTE